MNNTLPSWWASTNLASIVNKLVDGSHNPPAKQESGLPMLSAVNINNNQIIFSNYRNISAEDFENENARTRVEDGDVLLTIVGTIGRTAVVPIGLKPFTLQRSVAVITPVIINPRFLMYQFESPRIRKYFTQNARGTAQKGVYLKTLGNTNIWLPPYNEQNRILSKIEELFSEIDKGIENLTTAREQLKVYRQALLKHAFEGKLTEKWRKEHVAQHETADQLLNRLEQERDKRYQEQLNGWQAKVQKWEKAGQKGSKPQRPSIYKAQKTISKNELSLLPELPAEWQYIRLAEIAKIGSGMSVSKNRKLNNPVDVAYLRVANVQRGQLILDEIKTMPIEGDKLDELKLEKFDVLFNEGGDRDKLGRGWVWESQIDPCITQNHVFRATPYLRGDFHSKFISHWGNTFGQNYFDDGGKQTTNLASINKTVLSMFPIPMPTMEEQENIINEIERAMTPIESFGKNIETVLTGAQALRQAILKKAFSGQLVSQDPNDEPASELLARIKAERQLTEKAGNRLGRTRKFKKTE